MGYIDGERGRGFRAEIYTEDHEKLLGDAKEEWKRIGRVYDNANRTNCHQCRQKTIGPRSYCRDCEKRFCGDCLYMRYGENVCETLGNVSWRCPVCRDICNCSRCRHKKGWPPTGPMAQQALELGYKSVAHFLILTRRSDRVPDANAMGRSSAGTEQRKNGMIRKNTSRRRRRKRSKTVSTVDIIIVEDEEQTSNFQ